MWQFPTILGSFVVPGNDVTGDRGRHHPSIDSFAIASRTPLAQMESARDRDFLAMTYHSGCV